MVELDFGNVGFLSERKIGVPGKKSLATKGRTDTTLNGVDAGI